MCYAGALWWVHASIRSPVNVHYFQQYVALRCTAEHTEGADRPRSREALLELDRALQRCRDIEVRVDGTWGGIYGQPSVRLKVLSEGGAKTDFKYYSVAVSPILGTVSIRYELTPALYYLTV